MMTTSLVLGPNSIHWRLKVNQLTLMLFFLGTNHMVRLCNTNNNPILHLCICSLVETRLIPEELWDTLQSKIIQKHWIHIVWKWPRPSSSLKNEKQNILQCYFFPNNYINVTILLYILHAKKYIGFFYYP